MNEADFKVSGTINANVDADRAVGFVNKNLHA
jgi:hypothetical protein